MEDIAQRIKELIDDQGLSNTDFAKETNLNPAIISHILSGRNKPSLQVINQIKDSFTNVNLDYLITGSGQMYIDVTNVKSQKPIPEQTLFGTQGGLPMEGVRVVSEPGTVPQRAPEETPEINTNAQSSEHPPTPAPKDLKENNEVKDISQIPDKKEV